MVTIKLVEKDDKTAKYEYRPEQKGKAGIILYDIESSNIKVLEPAENDRNGSGFYIVPILSALSKSADNLPNEKTLMWH